jgi:Fe2+ or Zn2+ uptake regulation protein
MQTLETLLETVRGNVPRLTKGKKAVVEVLYAANAPMTAQEIFYACAQQAIAPDIDLATIYRNIEHLERVGIVCKNEHLHGSWRYCIADTVVNRHHSHTISCVTCGKEIAIGACVLAEVDKIIAERTGFQKIHHVVQFTGSCPECCSA